MEVKIHTAFFIELKKEHNKKTDQRSAKKYGQ